MTTMEKLHMQQAQASASKLQAAMEKRNIRQTFFSGKQLQTFVDGESVKEAEVFSKAEAVEAQKQIVKDLGVMNLPSDPAERVSAQAKLRIETDKLGILERSYSFIFDRWAKGGYQK